MRDTNAGKGRGNRDRGATHIASQFPIVQITFEDHKFALLEILVQTWCLRREPPEASALGPEAIRTQHNLALGVQLGPVLRESLQGL